MWRAFLSVLRACCALVLIHLGSCSCGGDDDAGCTAGQLGCPCAAGNRCSSGAVCTAGTCVAVNSGFDSTIPPGIDGSTIPPGAPDVGPNPDAFFQMDPPPEMCLEDGSRVPSNEVPGGTPDCPDDKNREGCRCDLGEGPQPCWPGLRANRNRGICRDGMTECIPFDEFSGRFGPCEGAVLPVEGQTLGPQACKCFSQGRWQIDNLSPCFFTTMGQTWAISTVDGQCPAGLMGSPPPMPAQPWSTNSLTVDCEGMFTLCYTIKEGLADSPMPTDCVIAETCTSGWYAERDVPQEFPVLPSWVSADSTCSTSAVASGNIYGEMSVMGLSVECDEISDLGSRYVFNRVQYCPLTCGMNPDDPACQNCMNGGSGTF